MSGKKRRKWDSKTKWLVVMEGLKGCKVADICTEHGTKTDQKQNYLERQNAKLKKLVGVNRRTQSIGIFSSRSRKLYMRSIYRIVSDGSRAISAADTR